jgi:hypothetical protein
LLLEGRQGKKKLTWILKSKIKKFPEAVSPRGTFLFHDLSDFSMTRRLTETERGPAPDRTRM